MLISGIEKLIPDRIRNYIILGKWFIVRLPYTLLYRLLLVQKKSLEKTVNYLPAPTTPEVYWTELKNIKLQSSLPYHPAGRMCFDGDWDITTTYPLYSIFDDIPTTAKKWNLHQTIRLIFIFKEHYTNTPQYKSMLSAIERKAQNPPQGCYTIPDVHAYFQRLVGAFNSMQKQGYLTQQELGKSSVDEIRLHVTREGTLCLGGGGNHRLRMAEIAGIKWVPFIIKGIHPKWVLHVSRQLNLPPHKAIRKWTKANFLLKKPDLA